MRQKLVILLGLVLLVLVLVGLNAATYVQKEKTPDNEISPNRSTYNSGATGTQGLYSLMAETGRKVSRWQYPIDNLLNEKRNPPATFVVVGPVRRPFDETEIKQLLEWVDGGGRLVVIDRTPPEELLGALREWKVEFKTHDLELRFGTDPADQKLMTADTPASKPVQPTVLTARINAVQTSRFASHIEFGWKDKSSVAVTGFGSGTANAIGQQQEEPYDFFKGSPTPESEGAEPPPPPPAKATPQRDPHLDDSDDVYESDSIASYNAPVVHLAGAQRNVLVDVRHGIGSIVFLSDPYIVSNTGVSLVDNAQLAINVLTAGGGLVAFDEYHQGYGSNQNRLFQYFAGTPVVAIFSQVALLIGLFFISKSRRFARAVPEPEPDRLTKLEYVAAMAELQQRTKAYDLAMENIFGEFRRRVSQLFGVDAKLAGRKTLASLIAERIKGDAREIEELMQKCEYIAHGEPSSNKETLRLAARLREIESQLGMTRTGSRRSLK